jgi:heme exporter protein C
VRLFRRVWSRLSRPSGVIVFGLLAVTMTIGLVVVPADRTQGDVQRIMYLHVPSAWLAYFAFFVTFVASLRYLWQRDLQVDRLAAAAAEVGLVFTGITIVTGSIWGKATWGVWWDWDPRMTTTAILFLLYLGYLLLRGSIVARERRARLSAVLGVIAFVNVPIVHFSVLWWRGLHQVPTVIRPGDPSIGHLLLATLLANVVSFMLLFAWLTRRREELETSNDASFALAEQRP